MNAPSDNPPTAALSGGWAGLRYGLLGMPLAFVALPLYVHLPKVYAQQFGLPLATLGAVLLLARLFDAVTDPLLGRFNDRLFERSHRRVLGAGGLAALVLVAGMGLLFFPPWATGASPDRLAIGLLLVLVLTTAAYSQIAIAHQSWGARLGGTEVERTRVVSWRESAGLAGVVLASVLPNWLGWSGWLTAFALLLALGWLLWCLAAPPMNTGASRGAAQTRLRLWRELGHPWRQAPFRRLMAVFVLSGLASAMPATLVLFFIQDRLEASAQEPWFLATYFIAAAASLPVWLRAVARTGLAKAWLIGMALSIGVFIWAATLEAGDLWAYGWVCALSGFALGADLALPGALLAGLIGAQGDRGQREGAYFGWWNLAAKLNLALAAGVTLPLLGWLGYQPGQPTPEGLSALTVAYAVLPCGIKLLAAVGLYWHFVRPGVTPVPFTPPTREDSP